MALGAGDHPRVAIPSMDGGSRPPAPAPAPLPPPAPVPAPQPAAVAGAGAQTTATAVTNTGGLTALMAGPGDTLQWKAPDLAKYDTQYAQALAASRGNIANQLQRALEDITAQEGIANQVVGTMPGRFNEIYDQTGAAAKAGLQGLYDAQQQTGLGNRYGTGLASAQQLQQPMEAAMGMGRSAFQATVPLAQLGTAELFTRQRGAMNQAQMGAEGDFLKSEQEWAGQRAGIEADIVARENAFRQAEEDRQAQQRQFNAEQENRARSTSFTEGRQDARTNAQLRDTNTSRNAEAASRTADRNADKGMTEYQRRQLEQDDRRIGLSERESAAGITAADKERRDALPSFSNSQVGFAKGELLHREQPRVAQQMRTTPAYKTLQTEFGKKFKNWEKDKADPNKVAEARKFLIEKAAGKPWDRSMSVLMYDVGLDDSEMTLGALAPKKGKKDKLGWWR